MPKPSHAPTPTATRLTALLAALAMDQGQVDRILLALEATSATYAGARSSEVAGLALLRAQALGALTRYQAGLGRSTAQTERELDAVREAGT